jgi:hypothetical protein
MPCCPRAWATVSLCWFSFNQAIQRSENDRTCVRGTPYLTPVHTQTQGGAHLLLGVAVHDAGLPPVPVEDEPRQRLEGLGGVGRLVPHGVEEVGPVRVGAEELGRPQGEDVGYVLWCCGCGCEM